MQLFEVVLGNARLIESYGAIGVSAGGLLELPGGVAANVLRFSPQSRLPEHEAGRPQLFIVLAGSGWVTGPGRQRVNVRAGQAVFWSTGELHESGSDTGMDCAVVQCPGLDLPSGLTNLEHPSILRSLRPAGTQ